ncbi:unnamed protein product [Rotaria sordida]|uniref:Uncharacterized protein n=1 Tax=Rotaria sordida TaxID=392033 RepID=A0A815D453_9BILA|nr:unnamed protein product [Rotaria sordida]CAF1340853.1 unnamed protein product [Rotaria sordida]
MTGCFEESAMIEEYVDELLNTFRTPFWLDECDWQMIYIDYHDDTSWIVEMMENKIATNHVVLIDVK